MSGIDLQQARRVLIIKLSAIGDILHALPVSAALGDAFPHLEIDWAVEETFAPLLTGNPFLRDVIELPKLNSKRLRSAAFRAGYRGRLRGIRQRGYDVSLDLQGLTKSAIVAVSSGAKVRLGYHWLREAARWLERPVPCRPESVHIVEQYLDVARYLGASPSVVRFPFHIPAADDAAVEAMLCAEGLRAQAAFVSINPASAKVAKEWGIEHYAALMDEIFLSTGTPSVLVTADKAAAARVGEATRQPFINLAGRTTLKQLAAVLKRSAVHVCGDTGSGHLAAVLERPVISLFGPTNPLRSGPYGQAENVLQHREVCDSRCSGSRCALSRPVCLNAIKVHEVLAKVKEKIAGEVQR